jgi:hypothetical protein
MPVIKRITNRNSRIVASTIAIIPNANMKVVIPNRNILRGHDLKAGWLLKAIYCKRASSFSSKAQLTE